MTTLLLSSRASFSLASCVMLAALSGCAVFSSASPRNLTAEAQTTESTKCRNITAEDELEAVSPKMVETVGPYYVTLDSARTGPSARLRGPELQLRAVRGFTPQWLTLQLECHNARRTLGKAPELPHDPYYLPGTALAFDVSAQGDGFLVRVETDDVHAAQRLLNQARAFLASP